LTAFTFFTATVIGLKLLDVFPEYVFMYISKLDYCRDKDSNGSIVAAEFDSSAKIFAACTDSKQLLLWNVEDEWKLYYRRFAELETHFLLLIYFMTFYWLWFAIVSRTLSLPINSLQPS